jgi:ABC-2 type transport system ATP-binding protein
MDEAERCHRLAILAEGRLVSEGVPQDLMREIPAAVVEVEAGDASAARRALAGDDAIRSIAQLGLRLHVLLDPATEAPEERVRQRLRSGGVEGVVETVGASLEDVFVAATGFRNGPGH